MERAQASRTAAWVASARSLGAVLEPAQVLARDPYGLRFASPRSRAWLEAALRNPGLLRPLLMRVPPLAELVLWMQLRTRALDDLLLDYLLQGGTQLVLLGAGFDCRALRFARELSAAIVYEIDHPATQHEKRARLGPDSAANTRYLAWNFEHDPLRALPAKLEGLGLDRTRPTLTLWEGVTMYLSAAAIEESLEAIHDFSAVGSTLAFNYIDRRVLEHRSFGRSLVARTVKRAGEPYQFGWHPSELESWLRARGFERVTDLTDLELADRYWPAHTPRPRGRDGRRIAVARRLG